MSGTRPAAGIPDLPECDAAARGNNPGGRQLDLVPAGWDPCYVSCAHPCHPVACAPTLVTQCGGPFTMAKALLGHVGGPDLRMVNEMRRLQQRVRDLEAELVRLQEEKDALAVEAADDLLVRPREPALT